jgi:hypothetical protein
VRATNDVAAAGGVAEWSKALSLTAGTNTITVTAADTVGNTTNRVIRLVPDTVRPTLAISSPTGSQRWSNTLFTVTGTAKDNFKVTGVVCQFNNGAWTTAGSLNGWSNWTMAVTLSARTNVLKAYATDAAGNKSVTNSVTFYYIASDRLTLLTTGPATFSPNYSNALLEVGRNYTITTTPGTGYVLSNWVGSVWGSTVFTSNATRLTFGMRSNLVLVANIIPNPFIPASGTYRGLFTEADRQQAYSGLFSLTLSQRGSYSGYAQIGARRYSLAGQFDAAGTASQVVTALGRSPLTVTLRLDLAGGGYRLTGSLGDAQRVAGLVANRIVFNSQTNPAAQYASKYTLIIPGSDVDDGTFPVGDGYARLTVDAGGNAAVAGALGEGTVMSQSVPISKDGEVPFYVSLYSGSGSILGWLMMGEAKPAADVYGQLSWIKPAQAAAKYYPGGFTNDDIMAVGSRYAPPAATNRVIDLTNGVVILEGGNLTGPLTNTVMLTSSNKVVDLSLSNKLSLTLTVSNGVFSGKVTPAGTTRTLSIQGALLQNLDAGYGYFLGTNRSGRVYFGP